MSVDYLNLLEKRTEKPVGKERRSSEGKRLKIPEERPPEGLRGLSVAEVEERRKEFGMNRLEGKKKTSAVVLFLSQFKDILVLILIVSAVLSMIMGEMTEAVTILIIIAVNALIGAVQEFKTEKTIEALEKLSAPVCKVVRGGRHEMVRCEELVPDDIILLEAGNRIPADGVLLEENGISLDESVLTGESVPLMKMKGERVFSGTLITRGNGIMRAESTGMQTEMGKIAGMLGEIEDDPTPLQRRLSELGKYIGIGCLVICAIVAMTGIIRGEPIFSMLVTGLSLAVAAVPEGLPAIVTIALALAVGRILKKGAVIKKLHAVETLGCATVICSDKTGTLTENRMTVTNLATMNNRLLLSKEGIREKTGELELYQSDRFFMECLVLCNNASVGEMEEGEPTELALLKAAISCGVVPDELRHRYKRLEEHPFDSERKRMSITVKTPEGANVSIVKGAPDRLLGNCRFAVIKDRVVPMTSGIRAEIRRINDEMADAALRVLACAYKSLNSMNDERENDLVFLGLAGMVDPPRAEVKDAVRDCKRAGIRPVMITGDYRGTAAAVAKEIGILKDGDLIVTGEELDQMPDDELFEKLPRITVFARVSPAHKLKVVRAFKKRGEVVAMTGDGVNDAPAIKEADIGVCMGGTGTDVSKEAASIILLEDSFSVIVSAVLEGRVIYANIRKFIRYLLSCNTGEVLTMFVGMLMGLPVILLPIQILLVNLVTDGLPATALGMDPGDTGILEKRPRKLTDGVFSDGLLSKILFRGALIALATLGTFVSVGKHGGTLEMARTAAFLTLVFTQLLHVFECKSEEKTLLHIPFFNNIALVLASMLSLACVLAAVYVPWCQGVFATVALSPIQMGIVLLYTFATPLVNGIALALTGKRKHR